MTIDEKAMRSLLDDKAFKSELKLFCETAINEELDKDDALMNCDLIDECTEILIELEKEDRGSAAILIPFISSEELIKKASSKGFSSLNRGARAAIVAAVAATLLIGTNAAIAETTGVNLLSNLGDTVYEALEDWGIIKSSKSDDESEVIISEAVPSTTKPTQDDSKTEGEEPSAVKSMASYAKRNNIETESFSSNNEDFCVALRLEFTEEFKSKYYWGEALSLKGIIVTAVYESGTTKQISINDCRVSGYNKALAGSQKVLIEYNGVFASFDITLVKTTPAQRVVTGVEGNAPTRLVYTTEDKAIDLSGIKLRLIYSDGTFSSYYYENAVSVSSSPDFSTAGEQNVTVRVANKADYTFTIIVQDTAPDTDIENISLNYSSYMFNVGESLAHHDFYVRVRYIDSNKPDEYLYFPEDAERLDIFNLDTSLETTSSKTFTVAYKGHFASATYTVRQRQTVAYSVFNDGLPKFLYYKGEPLGYGFGIDTKRAINSLVSSHIDVGNTSLTEGDDWCLSIYYYEAEHENAKLVEPSELDYIGYDPYKIGYQSIDIYYNGTYITSYNIFVYGDDGYCPTDRPNYIIRMGYESEDLKNSTFQRWYKCSGNGFISRNSSYSALGSKNYLYPNTKLGTANAYTRLTNGEVYEYRVNYVRCIKSVDFNSWYRWHFINIDNMKGYDYGEDSLIITYEDGGQEELNINELELAFTYDSGILQPITENSAVNSGFGFINVVLDYTKYANLDKLYNKTANAFFYRVGYEDTIQLVVEEKNSDYHFIYDTQCNENLFKNQNRIYLSSYDSGKTIRPKEVEISGVEWGSVGEYDAVLKTEYEGLSFETHQKITIASKVYTPELSVKYDPYTSQTFSTELELDCSDTVLTFIGRTGDTVELTCDDFTYEIISGGSGKIIDNEPEDNRITVRYYYTSQDGFNYHIDASYNTGFYVNNLQFFYSSQEEAVVVKFDTVEEADYYIIEALGKTYKTDKSVFYITDSIKKNMVYVNPIVTVTAVKIENGREITSSATERKDKLVIK